MSIFTVVLFLLIILLILNNIRQLIQKSKFDKSEYAMETKANFYKTIEDKGALGEYLTTKVLEKLPGKHRMIINAYIPNKKSNTTEIDVLFIHETGIYVLESKNYGGWIYGKDSDCCWTQRFPNGHESQFYNPILQNEGHIKALKRMLVDTPDQRFISVIVFSDRCQLKKVSSDILICRREHLRVNFLKLIKGKSRVLNEEEIENLYEKIKRYAAVSEAAKTAHIQNINNSI